MKRNKVNDDNWKTSNELREVTRFKLAICGSRDIDPKVAKQLIKEHYPLALESFGKKRAVIVSGGAKGVDTAAANLAPKLTGRLAYLYLADWIIHGKAAGPARNVLIAQDADALLLIWDGKSKGSRDVRSKFATRNKPIYEVEIDSD